MATKTKSLSKRPHGGAQEAPSEYRDSKGKFLKGCPPGPGNPNVRHLARAQRVLREEATEENLRRALRELRDMAFEKKDREALRVYIDRLFGRTREMPVEPVAFGPIRSAAEEFVTKAEVLAAMAEGRISSREAKAALRIIESLGRSRRELEADAALADQGEAR